MPAAEDFAFAIRVMNSAAHGHEVDPNSAQKAFEAGKKFLAKSASRPRVCNCVGARHEISYRRVGIVALTNNGEVHDTARIHPGGILADELEELAVAVTPTELVRQLSVSARVPRSPASLDGCGVQNVKKPLEAKGLEGNVAGACNHLNLRFLRAAA